MPNWTTNLIRMSGITTKPVFSTYLDDYSKKEEICFDFNKLIPRPEDLNVVEGGVTELAVETVIRSLGLKTMNDEAYNTRINGIWKDKSETELKEMGITYIRNKALYGSFTWYDWSCNNWGTKWNAARTKIINSDIIQFETAWSVPEPIIIKLSKMFPDLKLELWYHYEGGFGSGYVVFVNGGIVAEEFYEPNTEEYYKNVSFIFGTGNVFHNLIVPNTPIYDIEDDPFHFFTSPIYYLGVETASRYM